MIFLGLTQRQTDIVKSTQLGESYKDIATRLGMEEWEVIAEDFIALDILAKRWRQDEREVKRKIQATFLLFICLLMSWQSFTQTVSSLNSTIELGMVNNDESREINMIRTRTRTRSRSRKSSGDCSGEDYCNIVLEVEEGDSHASA